MDAFVALIALGVVVAVWVWLARTMRSKGRGWFLRHFAGSSAGLFAGLLTVVVALEAGLISPVPVEEQPDQSTAAIIDATEESDGGALADVEERSAVQEAAESVPATGLAKTLGVTPLQYATRLNLLLQQADLAYQVDGRSIKTGDVNDVLQVTVGDYAGLVATVSKLNGEVMNVTVIGGGDGTERSGLEIMLVATAAFSAATSDVEFEELFKGMPAMLKGQERTYGNVKLSATSMKDMGTWFIAEPI